MGIGKSPRGIPRVEKKDTLQGHHSLERRSKRPDPAGRSDVPAWLAKAWKKCRENKERGKGNEKQRASTPDTLVWSPLLT